MDPYDSLHRRPVVVELTHLVLTGFFLWGGEFGHEEFETHCISVNDPITLLCLWPSNPSHTRTLGRKKYSVVPFGYYHLVPSSKLIVQKADRCAPYSSPSPSPFVFLVNNVYRRKWVETPSHSSLSVVKVSLETLNCLPGSRCESVINNSLRTYV